MKIPPAATTEKTALQGRRFKPSSPVHVLVACGWLAPSDAVDPRLKVDTIARSHVVSRVTAPDGRAVVVKYPAEGSMEGGQSLFRELYVYRLAAWIDAIAAVLPRPILIDEARQVLVLDLLAAEQRESWPADSVSITGRATASNLGHAIAGWQGATKDIALWPSIAEGVLHLPDVLEKAISNRSPSGRDFMRFLVADHEFAAILREARAVYRERCLIHGDIRCDNWLLDQRSGQVELKVIDWEMSGSGDPAWDVASTFAEAILQAIREGMALNRGANGWPSFAESVLPTFLKSYSSAGGVVTDWDRMVLFTVARLLHIASEWAEYQVHAGSSGISFIVEEARQLLASRRRAAESLRKWAGQ